MIFEALQAKYGDSLLLTFNDDDGPHRLVVDGGPPGVFREGLKKRLEKEARDYPDETPLTLDAIMVSHVDEDHIQGILDLFGVLQDANEKRRPWPYRPRWLWHNSLDSLLDEGEGGMARALASTSVLAALEPEGAFSAPGEKRDATALLVLQSYGQAGRLSTMAAALQVVRNPPDKKTLMFDPAEPRVLPVGAANLRVVGPLKAQVDRLRADWLLWKAKPARKATAELAATLDDSIPNLSSIVALVEHRGHTVLLTGDALGAHILEGLELAGLRSVGQPMEIDILKLPHHGSMANATREFFEAVHARHYVASGDGTYGNPDRETLLMLEAARPDDAFDVWLTYDAVHCDTVHKKWAESRNPPRPYADGAQSIADVIARWKQENRITVHEGPVKIEL